MSSVRIQECIGDALPIVAFIKVHVFILVPVWTEHLILEDNNITRKIPNNIGKFVQLGKFIFNDFCDVWFYRYNSEIIFDVSLLIICH